MSHVRLRGIDVQLPIYDADSRRLLRLPSFGKAQVGTKTLNHSGAIVIQALSNFDLDLDDGDRVCLIGHNGAGKTTLLRVVANIYPPTGGTVDIDGSVVALLGHNLSLNPDATGYENVQLVADLYDWPRSRLPDYIRDIEEFTELGEYLSLPTRVYSAGMLTRLAFAMATMQPPDVLVIDEGIGAGDAHFQARAQARATKFIGQAKIMLLASHSVELCKAICTKALVLAKGKREFFGDIDEGFRVYAQLD